MITYSDYIIRVGKALRDNPGWRAGQAYFNVLNDVDPESANKIRGTQRDPFHQDSRLDSFMLHLILMRVVTY